MISRRLKISAIILILAIGTLASTACDEGDTREVVRLGYVNWAEGVAMNYLVHGILEDEMGYRVESSQAPIGNIFSSLAVGEYDAFVDAWLPFTHKEYMEEFGEDIIDLGENFQGARIGLVVPSYVEIDSIEEMNNVVDNFAGEIIGIGSGAGIMRAAKNAIETYELDYKLIESTDPIMSATLSKAIEEEEWIAVTGWEPHWKFAKWDLKFLQDPEGVFGITENIHTIARKDLEEVMPEVVQFLKNFSMNPEELRDLMAAMEEFKGEMDELEIARNWMRDHQELIDSWLP